MPKRRAILHLDMDSYFASVEQQDNSKLRGKPIAVGGKPHIKTVVAAASKEAKKFGVKSGMPTWQAKKLCPNLVFVPGRPSRYQEITRKIAKILERFSPLIEIASIDEFFLDITDTTERFGGTEKIAKEIKKLIRKNFGEIITCSIGIAPNKLMAKVAAELCKPDGILKIDKKEISKILAQLSLSDLCGIGPKTETRLQSLKIYTLEQLAKTEVDVLVSEFGIYGKILKNRACGIDNSPVIPYFEQPPEKSMGHSYTLPYNTCNLEYIKAVLLKLSEKVARRLRKNNLAGRTISLTIRNEKFETKNYQKTITYTVNGGYEIFRIAKDLLRAHCNMVTYCNKTNHPLGGRIRLVGVSVSNLVKIDNITPPLLAFEKKLKVLVQATDRINDKFGEFTIFPAKILQAKMEKEIARYYGRMKIS